MDILTSLEAREHTYTCSIWNFAVFFSDCVSPNIPLSHMEIVIINSTCTKIWVTLSIAKGWNCKNIHIFHGEILPPLLGNKLFFSSVIVFGVGFFGSLPMIRIRKYSSNLERVSAVTVPPRPHTAAKRNRYFSNSVTSSSMAPFEVISSISRKECTCTCKKQICIPV